MTNDGLRRFSGTVENQLALPLGDRPSPLRSARVTLSLPSGLLERVRQANPELNLSEVFQKAMQEVLDCPHRELRCARCSAPIDHREIQADVLGRFFSDAMWALGELIYGGGTAEGAHRVLKRLAIGWGVPGASDYALARRPKGTRQRMADEQAAAMEAAGEQLPAAEELA